MVVDIVNLLRSEAGRSFGPDDLKAVLDIDIVSNSELYKALQENPYIDIVDGKLVYKVSNNMTTDNKPF